MIGHKLILQLNALKYQFMFIFSMSCVLFDNIPKLKGKKRFKFLKLPRVHFGLEDIVMLRGDSQPCALGVTLAVLGEPHSARD